MMLDTKCDKCDKCDKRDKHNKCDKCDKCEKHDKHDTVLYFPNPDDSSIPSMMVGTSTLLAWSAWSTWSRPVRKNLNDMTMPNLPF